MSGAERLQGDTTSENHSKVEELGGTRYAVTGKLGEGSQGETLEAVDKRDGRLVAIKRFRIRGADSWKSVELAEREARVLSSLAHPLLPRYVEHFEESGALCLVMEKVEGPTLGVLSRQGALDQHEVVRLLNDVADVLEYLHLRAPPIIHRDIKPSNIIRRPNGRFALVDFGSVRDRLKPEGGSTVVGTFGFMAPEQFQGRALPVSDVYGLGATALAAITGVSPDELPHQGLAIDVEHALGGQIDRRLVHVLGAMLKPDPDARCSSVVQLLTEQRLRLTPEQRGGPTPPRTNSRPSSRSESRGSTARRRHRQRRTTKRHAEGWFFGNAFVIPLMLLGLQIGKLATWGLFSVALPVLFGVLSIFFGRPLRPGREPRRVHRHLHALRAPGVPGALRRGLLDLHLPVPRRRLRLRGAGHRRPAGPAARPLPDQGQRRPAGDRAPLQRHLRPRAGARP
jgi:serine/threonine protein kinase